MRELKASHTFYAKTRAVYDFISNLHFEDVELDDYPGLSFFCSPLTKYANEGPIKYFIVYQVGICLYNGIGEIGDDDWLVWDREVAEIRFTKEANNSCQAELYIETEPPKWSNNEMRDVLAEMGAQCLISCWQELIAEWETSDSYPDIEQAVFLNVFVLPEFQQIFFEWFENYYSEYHCSDDFYRQKALEYVRKMAELFPPGHKKKWEQRLFNDLVSLSKNDYTASVIVESPPTDDLIADSKGVQRAVHQLLYESHFSPLLNVEEESVPGINYTYIVSHKNIEICRIGVEYEHEELIAGVTALATWRTQIIHTDAQRAQIWLLWSEILAGVYRIRPAIKTHIQQRQQQQKGEAEVSNDDLEAQIRRVFPKPTTEKRRKRLIELTQLYQKSGHYLTQEQIAEQFGVSIDTIQGDLDLLKKGGFIETSV